MGYRSDVKYIMAFKTEEARTKFLGEVALIVSDHPDQAVRDIPSAYKLTTYENCTNPFIIRVHHEDVKWYKDYPSVAKEMSLLKLAEDTYDADWELARAGSDEGDIERLTSHDTYMGEYIQVNIRTSFC